LGVTNAALLTFFVLRGTSIVRGHGRTHVGPPDW
jgi:hypothetical protein